MILLYLGLSSFRPAQAERIDGDTRRLTKPVATTLGGSWPSGIFAAGIVTASWFFFFILVLIGSLLRRKVTPQVEVWISRFSGAIMLLFAVILALEAIK